MSPSPEMVVSGGYQINRAWQMEIVSKPIFFCSSKCGSEINTVTIFLFLIVTMIRDISSTGIGPC